MRKLIFFFYLIFLFPNIVSGKMVEIYSLDQMDDQRGFCIDIRGHKSKAKWSHSDVILLSSGFAILILTTQKDVFLGDQF